MFRAIAITTLFVLAAASGAVAQATSEADRLFVDPPAECRPAMWWFWGESVTTEHGITQDLEAMKRVGIGGVVIYEQVFADRPDALKSLSAEWLARVRFAAKEATRLGMKLEVNVSNGYVSGGPWITPELGMQRLVASETVVAGGKTVSVRLPQPPTKLDFYRDVAVLAYPETHRALPTPKRSSSQQDLKLEALFDPRNKDRLEITPAAGGGPVLIDLDYGEPVTLRSITYRLRPSSNKATVIATQMPGNWSDDFLGQGMRVEPPIGQLQVSNDGVVWRDLCDLPHIGRQHDSWDQMTVAFPTTEARYFRISLQAQRVGGGNQLQLSSIELSPEARIDRWEAKSGNVVAFSDPDRTPAYKTDEVIAREKIIDLTGRLDPDGTLRWDAPPGEWRVMRLGHTPTGTKTKHGRPETTGLQSDSLSRRATRVQFENYAGRILGEINKVPGAKLYGVTIDSAEQGSQNWTADFADRFREQNGYEIAPLLPVMMGKVVSDRGTSDRFLFDVRRTIANLNSTEFFGEFKRLCNEKGVQLMAEAPGIATCFPSDNIQAKGQTDVPMGEFWMSQAKGTIDCKEAAMAAHVYGKNVAAAEAFTGSMPDAHPAMMKPLADAALSLGINKFYALAYVHQPWDDRVPGVAEDRFFLPHQRHNTWWEFGRGFWDTLARSCYLMQQGRPAADLLYHLGNDTPLKVSTSRMRPVPPEGYDFDVCSDEALIDRVSVKNGRITLPDGVSYRLLVLAGGDRVTKRAAIKIRSLVGDGAAVLLDKRWTGSPSLADGEVGDATVKQIAAELWGEGSAASGRRDVGRGRTYWGIEPAALLEQLSTAKDFEVIAAGGNVEVLFARRQTDSTDSYFIANHANAAVSFEALFRSTRKHATAWDPQTAKKFALAAEMTADGRSKIRMHLEAYQSLVVVFSDAATEAEPLLPLMGECEIVQKIEGPWNVSFMPDRGAPERQVFPELISWTEHSDKGIQSFSGSATYEKQIEIAAPRAGQRIFLDLGKVNVVAAVTVNGRPLDTPFKPPFAVDITEAMRPGQNMVIVRVANTWVNRLIADAGLPAEDRISWTTFNPYRPDAKKHTSGLLGPVVLRSYQPGG